MKKHQIDPMTGIVRPLGGCPKCGADDWSSPKFVPVSYFTIETLLFTCNICKYTTELPSLDQIIESDTGI